MLLGYAISYSSAFLAGRCSTRKSAAAAAGGSDCRIIGKPAEQWDDAESFLRYFQSDPVIDELQALQVQVANLRQRLQSSRGSSTASASRRCTGAAARSPTRSPSARPRCCCGETGVGKEAIARSLHPQ
jgi:transcriptional regulator of acetoin/glycerol metabolism